MSTETRRVTASAIQLSTAPDLGALIRLPVPRDDVVPAAWAPSLLEFGRAAARPSSRKGRDEDDEDDDDDEEDEEEEKPRARKKRPKDEEEEEEEEAKPRKKGRAKEKDEDEEEEEEEEVRERRVPKKGSRRYQFYVVGMGLATLNGTLIALLSIAFISSIFLTIFQVLEWDKVGAGVNKQPGSIEYGVSIFVMVLQAALAVAFLVVEVMLFYTPAKADARGSLIAALVLHLLPLLFLLFYLMSSSMGIEQKLADRLADFMLFAAHGTFWLGFLMLVGYLKQFYYYLGDKPSGNNISTLGLFYVIVIVLGYVLYLAQIYSGIDWLYFILLPGWFLWDGAISRVHVLLLRQVARVRKRVERLTYPDEEDEEPKKKKAKA